MVLKGELSVGNRHLRHIMKSNLPSKKKIILFGGDFCQVLPVLGQSSRITVVENIFKQSPLLSDVKIRKCTQTMKETDNRIFTVWILKLDKLGL